MHTEVATCLSQEDTRKLNRRCANRASAHRVKKRLEDGFADMHQQVQDAQAELQRNTHLCAVLRAHAAALSQQVKHYTQLQDKAHVDNASLHEQLAAVAAAWDEERHKALIAQSVAPAATSSVAKTEEAAQAPLRTGTAPQTASSQILPDALIEDLPTMALPSPDTAFTDMSGILF